MKNKVIVLLFLITISFYSNAQLPTPAIVGYWESWNGGKFVNLKDIDDRYNVIHIAFAALKSGNDYQLTYTPPGSYNETDFKSEVADLQAQGKKVIISIGGQNDHVMLDSEIERDEFVTSMNAIIDYWGFDGFDIDLEGSSLNFSNINIQTIGDIRQQYLIDAIKKIMENHYAKHGKKLLLTMAPETIYVQGALSQWAGPYRGAYLPMIEALKDSIDMLNVQLYNSGSMYGLDGQAGGEFRQGNADFVIAMTEAVIKGYAGTGTIGNYSGIDASKVGVALPGCHSIDAVPAKELQAAMKYLLGKGPQPGNYKLKTTGGFPNLKGMMTWSINSDKNCDPSYGFVDTYSKIFTDSSYIEIENGTDIYEQSETGGIIKVNLFKDSYAAQLDTNNWTVSNLPSGVSVDSIIRVNDSTAHIVLKGNSPLDYTSAIWNIKVEAASSEFVKSTLSLSRGNGVIFKKNRTKIPGTLQAEDFSAYKNAYIVKHFNNEDGLMLRYNETYSADFEIDVVKTAEYDFDFRVASAPGTFSTIIKIDGTTKSTQQIPSSTSWKTWEIKSYKMKLDSGHHVLTLYMNAGWMNIDWIEFKEAEPNTGTSFVETKKVMLYPNPAHDVVYSNSPLNNAIIYSLDGQVIKKWSTSTSTFNLSEVAAGSYFLSSDEVKTKIILQ